jgi:hypothetical protein
MTFLRTASVALTLLATSSLIALPATAGATSMAEPPKEPSLQAHELLWHKGSKVGTADALITGGGDHVVYSNVFAMFTAPKAGLTWKARVIASFNCATEANPAKPAVVTHFERKTTWTTTKLTGTKGKLKAIGFEHQCAPNATLTGPMKVRVQVSQPSGLAWAFSTIDSAQ